MRTRLRIETVYNIINQRYIRNLIIILNSNRIPYILIVYVCDYKIMCNQKYQKLATLHTLTLTVVNTVTCRM